MYKLPSFLLLALLVNFSTWFYDSYQNETSEKNRPEFKGVCWVGGDSITSHNIDQIQEVGVNWISQTPFGWMEGHDSPQVILNNKRAWWGESDHGLVYTASLAKECGIKTMLKPHLWIRGKNGKWRSDIAMLSNEDWDRWFSSYSNFILHYAHLAERHQIEMLCIGTELYQTTKQQPQKWRALIADIRKVYNGKLTYAANWYKEFEEISFWDELDYIGIQGYFPLSKKSNPDKTDLIKSWNRHKKSISRISDKYQKQVIFTEIGYKNTADSAIEPWTWPQHLDHSDISLSSETQKACYEAMFESLWQEPWMEGVFIWKWFHSTYKYPDIGSYMEERKQRIKRRYGQISNPKRHEVFFSPQLTSSLNILEYYYQQE